VTDSGWDSYLDDDEENIADTVAKFVVRFVDRVGTEAGIRTEHMKSLYDIIPGWYCIFITQHIFCLLVLLLGIFIYLSNRTFQIFQLLLICTRQTFYIVYFLHH
jgi:hypothetical protein